MDSGVDKENVYSVVPWIECYCGFKMVAFPIKIL